MRYAQLQSEESRRGRRESRTPSGRRTSRAASLLLNVFAVFALLAALAALAACSRTTTGAQSSSASPSAAPPGATHVGRGSVDGCPSLQAPADAASFSPDVVVTQGTQSNTSPQTITLAAGQRLELRLQPTVQWTLASSDSSHILAGTTPEGWYDPARSACIWHFTATGTGNAQLRFSGPVVCPPLEVCPSDDQSLTYEIAVK